MHRRHLEIAQPCGNDWSQMQGTSSVRHCIACSKNVYNLSMLTEREAKAALAVRPKNVCIRYHFDASGHVVFYPEQQPGRLRAVPRHTLAAALAVSAISACAQPEPSTTRAAPVMTPPVATAPAQTEAPPHVANAALRIATAPAPTPVNNVVEKAAPDAGVDKTPECDSSWHKSFKRKHKRKTDHLPAAPDLQLQGGYPPDR